MTKVYTVSSIKKLLGCNHFIKKDASFALERGSIIHSILDTPQRYDKVASVYRGEKRAYTFEHDFEEYEQIAANVKELYPQYFTNEWLLETELRLNYNDKVLGEIELNGIIDKLLLTNEKAIIVDWKSGVSRADKDNPFDMLQALFYTFLVMQKYQYIPTVEFNYVYVEQNHQITTTTMNTPDIRKQIYRTLRMWIFATKYAGGNIKIGSGCAYCGRLTSCPLVNTNLEILEKNPERLDVNQIKLLKSLITKIYDIRKVELIDELPSERVKIMNYYYVAKEDLSIDTILKLTPDTIKITKAVADDLIEANIPVVNKKTKALR